MSAPRVAVVGAGIVGLATAFRLLERRPDAEVVVLEKEAGVARHQSSRNSGVLHAGLYYAPGSAKARLAVRGIREMRAFCERHDVPHEVCGKLVVAVDERELPRLRDLLDRGRRNGLAGLRWLEGDRLREIEPHAAGVAAVQVPEEGIADFGRVCAALVDEVERRGGRVVTGARVRALERRGSRWHITSTAEELEADAVVNAAGLYADRVAALAGHRPPLRIVPFRGEYFTLRPERRHLVRNLLYPVPDPAFPFLGVHFTRTVGGEVECGPNAVLAFAREGYSKRVVRPRDLAGSLSYVGLWRFLGRYPSTSWMELRRSFSRRLFGLALQRLVPAVRPEDLRPGIAGVRAQAITHDGRVALDFVFLERPGAVHVLSAPSPGATAALTIGDEIVARLERQLG